ncbi:MAG: hypothetical protein CMJ83_08680 [Planctomycetes bacterium]|nr:hypothetical protein [Planctomycetota bacterium]
MLFKQRFLDALASGGVDLAFRRWDRARAKVGTKMRTSHGLVEVLDVEVVPMTKITERDARRAGRASRAELLELLKSKPKGRIHRVRLRLAGEDPRIALRAKASFTKDELADVTARLARLDQASRRGAWTRTVLELVRDHPGVRAPDLADGLGLETLPFKRDVRKLKELGLTESLKVGYRLSPRGETLLLRL